MITLPRLIACGISPAVARVWADPLAIASVQFGIATVPQQAGWLAQMMHESAKLTHLEESLYYSKATNIARAFKRLRSLPLAELDKLTRNPKGLAAAAYSNVNGNGGPETTDGWDMRGGGPFQLTGRANYRECGEALGRPFEAQPELVRVPGLDGALSAAWFWTTKGCNQAILTGNIDQVGAIINGANPPNGASERREFYSDCLTAMR